MNSDSVPTISTAWERVLDSEIGRTLETAFKLVSTYIE